MMAGELVPSGELVIGCRSTVLPGSGKRPIRFDSSWLHLKSNYVKSVLTMLTYLTVHIFHMGRFKDNYLYDKIGLNKYLLLYIVYTVTAYTVTCYNKVVHRPADI